MFVFVFVLVSVVVCEGVRGYACVGQSFCFVLALLDEQHLYVMAFVLRLGKGRGDL